MPREQRIDRRAVQWIASFRVQREPSAQTRRHRNKQRNRYFHPPITRPGSDALADEKEFIMAECSVCGKPATSQITITENGQRRQLMLCDEHCMEFMARNQRRLSPLESLFHGGLFDSLFERGTYGSFSHDPDVRPREAVRCRRPF